MENITTPDFTWLFVKMVAGLVLVLGLAIVLIRYVLPKTRMGRMRVNSWAEVIDRLAIDSHKSLMLIKMSGRYFVLAASGEAIGLVTELSKEEGEKIETG